MLFAYGVRGLGDVGGSGWLHGLKVAAVAVVAQAVLGMMRSLAPDRERAKAKADNVFNHGGEHDDEFRIIRTDGEVLWLASKGRVIRTADGLAERVIGVNIDVTDRHRDPHGRSCDIGRHPVDVAVGSRTRHRDIRGVVLHCSCCRREVDLPVPRDAAIPGPAVLRCCPPSSSSSS